MKPVSKALKTKLIGVKDFRQNLAHYYAQGVKNGLSYIVTNRDRAIFEVKPLSKKEAMLKKLAADIAHAEQQVREGKVYTLEQVRQRLGI